MSKTKVAAKDGWFTLDEAAPALIGSRCNGCGTYAFPAEQVYCKNPACDSESFEQVELSRSGRIWSYTNACYQPPAPYIPTTDPFEPFALAAVELEAEKLIVIGQMTPDVSVEDLKIGMPVELVLDVGWEDDEHQYMVWRWKRAG
ncbi:MAG: benzoylsuccinyl-CoA thiolase [Candidatus Dadabacteria bacterium]|nr:MAG: benzoylsuccinyl-CoA thiolase [Candidatus Dadabacteria bacterium]